MNLKVNWIISGILGIAAWIFFGFFVGVLVLMVFLYFLSETFKEKMKRKAIRDKDAWDRRKELKEIRREEAHKEYGRREGIRAHGRDKMARVREAKRKKQWDKDAKDFLGGGF